MRLFVTVSLLLACTYTARARDYPDVSACSFGVSTGLCSLRPAGVDHVCNPCDSRSYIQCSTEVVSEEHVRYCADGKLFDPLTGSCENADSVRLTCYDVISRPSAASQVAGATHWRITNWFTYQQDKACGFLGWLLAKLLPASSHCTKHVVLHASARSTTLTGTLNGRPAVVTTTTISSTSYDPQPLLQHRDTTASVPHFIDPDSLPSGQSVSSGSLAAYLRGKQQQQQQQQAAALQQPMLVLDPDMTSDLSKGSRGYANPVVPNSILQQIIPRLAISSEAIAEMLQERPITSVPGAGTAAADAGTDSVESGIQTLGAEVPEPTSGFAMLESGPAIQPLGTSSTDPAAQDEHFSDAAAAAALQEQTSVGEYTPQDVPLSSEAMESAVAEDAGSDGEDAPRSGSHPFDSSDVVVPT